jgi:predicted permease
MENTWQDLRYAARSLRRSPGFVGIAVLTLALGIGANAMIYAVVDGVLIRGLPFEDSDRLVLMRNGYVDGREGAWLISFPDYEDYRAGIEAFGELAAWQNPQPALASADGEVAQRLNAADVTANLLPMLGAAPFLGRGFLPEEDSVEAPQRAAILSYDLWQTRFAADPGVLGETILLDELPFVVVGVLPLGFTGVSGGFVLPSEPVDIWLPYRASFAVGGMKERGLTNVNVLGKLRPDTTVEQATSEAVAIGRGLDPLYPDLRNGIRPHLFVAEDKAVDGVRQSLLLSFGAVSLLLLIACTNVANLLIGRASVRQREMALRTALGAGRLRLVRQLVGESLILAGLGALAGAVVAAAGLRLLAMNRALEIARLDTVAIDGRVFLFLFALSTLAGLAFGVGPALFATSRSPSLTLRSEGRSVSGRRSLARRALVVAQLGLAVVMLIGAGLLLRSLQEVLEIDPGFEPGGVLTARVQLPMAFVSDDWPRAVEFFEQFEARARQLPGAVSVASAFQLPTDAGWNNAFDFDLTVTAPRELPEGESYHARFNSVTPGYFETAGVRLVRGRTFNADDHVDGRRVVVVNERFVDVYFEPGTDPIGARLVYGNWWQGGEPLYEIVGVVQDVRFQGRTQDTYQATYFPHPQQPVRELTLLISAAGDPLDLVGPLRAELQAIDPSLPLDDVALLADNLAAHEAARRSLAVMLVVFAATAVTLAAIGVYGVMAFLVAQRTREMGIRVALGARVQDVRAMVLLSGLRLTATGLAAGLAGAFLLGGVLDRMLYGIEALDPATWVAVSAFLGLVALAASWLPARRATGVDPMMSLRAD